jgi:hypothetical protein
MAHGALRIAIIVLFALRPALCASRTPPRKSFLLGEINEKFLEVPEGAGSPNLLKVASFVLFSTFTCNLHLSPVMKMVLTRRRQK